MQIQDSELKWQLPKHPSPSYAIAMWWEFSRFRPLHVYFLDRAVNSAVSCLARIVRLWVVGCRTGCVRLWQRSSTTRWSPTPPGCLSRRCSCTLASPCPSSRSPTRSTSTISSAGVISRRITFKHSLLTHLTLSELRSMCLTLWRPLLPHGYSYKASCARPG